MTHHSLRCVLALAMLAGCEMEPRYSIKLPEDATLERVAPGRLALTRPQCILMGRAEPYADTSAVYCDSGDTTTLEVDSGDVWPWAVKDPTWSERVDCRVCGMGEPMWRPGPWKTQQP
jgi:hypothetical protein